MSKGSIKDSSISLKPSVKLIDFILSLSDQDALPENILKIYQVCGRNKPEKIIYEGDITKPNFTKEEIDILKELNSTEDSNVKLKYTELIELADNLEENINEIEIIETIGSVKPQSKTQAKKLKEEQKQRLKDSLFVQLDDIKWINTILTQKRQADPDYHIYLHELIEESRLILPKNEILERNPELEARCVKLRLEQDARKYRNMTRNVDATKRYIVEDTVSYQVKQINRQLIAIAQFVFSVAAGFAFGFIGVELIVGNLDFGFRLLLGIMCALIIALAEIYFLAKRLNEEYDMSVEQPQVILKSPATSTTNSASSDHINTVGNVMKEHQD